MVKRYKSFQDFLAQTGRKQRDVSKTLNVSEATVSRWNSGASPVSSYAAKAISCNTMNESFNQFSQQLVSSPTAGPVERQIAESIQQILEESNVEIEDESKSSTD